MPRQTSLTRCTVSGNTAGDDGGGLLSGTARLTACTVSGNTAADSGGGIHCSADTQLSNCTVSGNTAGGSGGGIFATETGLLFCTIVENSAHTGGGLFHDPEGAFEVHNSIIALNLTDLTGTGPDAFGTFDSLGFNLIGDGTGSTGFANAINGNLVGTRANPIDPKLGPLQNNGGKTQTHKLRVGSPAIDAGDSASSSGTDQRGFGFARKKDGNFDGLAIVDIGAFER